MFREMGKRTFTRVNAARPGSMNTQTFVHRPGPKWSDLFARREGSQTGEVHAPTLRIDLGLLLTVLSLLIFGLVMVYSSSYDLSYLGWNDVGYFFKRQFGWVTLSVLLAVILTFVDYHWFKRLAVIGMSTTVLMLVMVLLWSQIRNGAARTLWGGSIQPSELAKLVIVIYLSVWLDAKREQLSDMSFGLLPLGAILGVMGGLILAQPDLSATLTVFFLGGMMFFLAGGDKRQIAFLVILAVLVASVMILFNPTGSSRITMFLASWDNPFHGPYHLQRIFEAFNNGGWFGMGIGKGIAKVTQMPTPHTDAIFAVIGEETGVVGAMLVVLVFVAFLWRGLAVARNAPDELGRLLAGGLTVWIVVEAFINMTGVLSLSPFAGNALPLISYGGSNLIVTLAAIGIIMNVSYLSSRRQEESERTSGAVVDLRRWDGRRSVPRVRRSTGSQ